MKTFIDFVYAVLIGLAVSFFVGFGIWTFYQGPKAPDFPDYAYSDMNDEEREEQDKKQEQYNKEYKEFEKRDKAYGRNVAIIATVAAVPFYAAGLRLLKRNDVIGEGLALGGIFTTFYALLRAAGGELRPVVFLAITLMLAMLIGLVFSRRSLGDKNDS